MTAPDRPANFADFDDLARAAAAILAQREASYPRLVEAQRVTQADADAAIRVARAIAADWQYAIDHATPPAASASRAERIAAMDQAVQRLRQRLDKARRDPRVPPQQLDAIERQIADAEALHWWERHPYGIRWMTACTIAARSAAKVRAAA